jgi:elongation factor 1-gamma
LNVLDKILSTRTYLVGEHVTLADIAVFSALSSLFKLVLDDEARKASPNVTRWFTTIANQPEVKSVIGEPALAQKVAVYEGKKEEKKPKEAKEPKEAKKEEKKPKKEEKHDDEEEDEAPKEEKKPNPLDLLPPSPFKLDDWKRFYSNNDTRPDAINYFWQHFDPEGYSMWRVDYKYNDELVRSHRID